MRPLSPARNQLDLSTNPLGVRMTPGGAHVRIWTTTASKASLAIHDASGARVGERPLAPTGDGHFEGTFADLGPGTLYKIELDGTSVPDPYARFLPLGVHGPAELLSPTDYRWKHPARRRRLDELSAIYEIHVGTFTAEGTYAAAATRLPEIAALGVSAIELMPLASFPGSRGWGYDGVGLFAPHAAYGRPDELRAFIDEAHGLGLSVLLDVVYNHFGPDGNYLWAYSPSYFSQSDPTPWGPAPSYAEPHMRALALDNARYWLEEFQLDGLRLDATHEIVDHSERHLLRELAERVHAMPGRPLLLAEDDRNEPSLVHEVGLDGLWSDDLHHQIHVALTGEQDGYYAAYEGRLEHLARTIERGWFYEGQPWPASGKPRGRPTDGLERHCLVCGLQNHDQIGNRALGERLSHLVPIEAYLAAATLMLFLPVTPLIFMGEEWAATSPFLYFTDHEPELGKKVTEGRQSEFGSFKAFATAEARARVPDPQAPTTHRDSILDWGERVKAPHSSVLSHYRALLELRRNDPVLSQTGAVSSGVVGRALWALRERHGEARVAIVNLGEPVELEKVMPRGITAPRPLLASSSVEASNGPLPRYGAVIVSGRSAS